MPKHSFLIKYRFYMYYLLFIRALGWKWERGEERYERQTEEIYYSALNLIMTDTIYHMERMDNKFKSDRAIDDSRNNNGFGTFPACHCAKSPNDSTERECNKCFMISFESDT